MQPVLILPTLPAPPLSSHRSLTHLEQRQGSISALELLFGQREEGKLARQRNNHQQHCCRRQPAPSPQYHFRDLTTPLHPLFFFFFFAFLFLKKKLFGSAEQVRVLEVWALILWCLSDHT